MRAAYELEKNHPDVAAAMFFAAANRLLILMGGTGLTWDSTQNQFATAPGDTLDPAHPDAAPKLVTDTFGGMGMVQSKTGPAVTPWENAIINGYSPSDKTSPSPLQLFPSSFTLGANDVPVLPDPTKAVESMDDLGVTMSALIDFLNLSKSSGNLGPHFIDADKDPDVSTKIIDPTQPALFPSQGRQLAIGLIAAIVQNMISANGHVQLASSTAPNPPTDDHSGVLGIRYFDQINLQTRLDGKVSTAAIASVFGAAARFSTLVGSGDPDVPPELVQFKSTIDQAVAITVLSILGRSQQTDGGFVDQFGDPANSPRKLDTQLTVISTLMAVYDQTRVAADRLTLRQAWEALDRFWPKDPEGVPNPVISADGKPDPTIADLSPVLAWKAIQFWNQTKSSALYADLMNPSLDQRLGKKWLG